MAEKKKKDDMVKAVNQPGQAAKQILSPVAKVVGAMDKAGRWLFGDPKKEKKKRLDQAGIGGK